ncbi:splicing factor 3B subunit 4-like isoform X1 [Hylaeus volcanicus]|uniref:splicing factor 3B subunit 4-like isoform X1 n=2 Tax=Hylaeus volcanicus TaxID=313075 RepID=UPI0023B77D5C|nr:splicing factor 3B subunit 4-like isoform X1 [Hylaeus volcanicus]XP_053990811.1 splicing factor 3B subunit 4-like isoform X1 [Hylaeus volcanicus]
MTSSLRGDINQIYERNQEATVYVGNLDSRTDEELLWEIFTQGGPVKNVHIPRDKITGMHSNYGFVEFQLESDADYALKIFNMVKVYSKPLRCNKAAQDKRTLEVGANLFVGNLDPDVDEPLLYDTMSAFGNVLSTKVMRDTETGEHRGFGFVAFDAFESSDAALAAMNGQFLCDRPIHVSYAYKKDTKGERHGSAAERLIAGSRQTLVKDQQQQQVMATVMSSMMNSMMAPQAVTGYQRSTNMALPPSFDTNVIPMQPNVMSGMMARRAYEMPPNQYSMLQQMNLHQPASLDLNNALLMNPSTPSCQMMYPPSQLPPVMNSPDLPAGMPLPPPFRHPRPMYPPVYMNPTVPPSPHI